MNFISEPALTLDDVEKCFEEWRSAKKIGARIPPELWALTKSLKGKYKISEISKRLRVSGSQLQREGLALPSTSKKQRTPKKNQFVNVNLDMPQPVSAAFQSSVVLKRTDGMQLSLSQPSIDQLALFITAFIE